MASAYRFSCGSSQAAGAVAADAHAPVPGTRVRLRIIARSMGMRTNLAAEIEDAFGGGPAGSAAARKLFYRPLLNAVARLDSGEARADSGGGRGAAAGPGYQDPGVPCGISSR